MLSMSCNAPLPPSLSENVWDSFNCNSGAHGEEPVASSPCAQALRDADECGGPRVSRRCERMLFSIQAQARGDVCVCVCVGGWGAWTLPHGRGVSVMKKLSISVR